MNAVGAVEGGKVGRRLLNLGVFGKIPVDTLCEVYVDTEDGNYVTIYQTKNANTLGSWVYVGAACLAKYLESEILSALSTTPTPLAGKRLIELGAGTGVVGLLAAHYGADVCITDLEALVPLLQYNAEMNAAVTRGSVVAKTLKWGDNCSEFLPEPDFLILANCIYYLSSFEPLLETMLELCGENTRVLACYELRTPEIAKIINSWQAHIAGYFETVEIVHHEICSKYKKDFVKLVELKRITRKSYL